MTKFRLFFLTSLLAGFSLTFTACDKDDDDDDDKKNDEQVDNKAINEEGNETSASSLVGSWKINIAKSTEQVWLNGNDLGEGEEDPDDPMTEDDFMFGGNVKFNSDGTCSLKTGEDATYKLDGTQLSLTYTMDGKSVTLQKGADAAEIAKAFSESMGVEASLVTLKSSKIDDLQAVVEEDGKVLHIKTTSTSVMDLSQIKQMAETNPEYSFALLGFSMMGVTDFSNISFKMTTDDVYDKEGIKLVAK